MNIADWGARWGVGAAALTDLRVQMGLLGDAAPEVSVSASKPGSEARQQSLVRLEAPKVNVWLTRNNVGALLDKRGIPVRYGLCNESKAQNEQVKSADLIGLRPVLVGQQHVGTVIGQFVSRECKHEGWTYSGDKHEVAQLNWCNFVLSLGGDAAFCTGPGSFNQRSEK